MSVLVRNILLVYGVLSLLATLLYLPKIFGFRYGFKKPQYKRAQEKRKISVIVPARGESEIIGDLFASLRQQTYDHAFFEVNVIVKDADDPTVELAKEFGARVFIVSEQRCKGDALDGYFKAVLAPDYLFELNNALEHDYDIYLTRKFAKNYLGEKKDRSLFSNCSTLTWPMIDDLGNLYRMQKDMPLNLCGQGMMLRRRIIEELGGWPYRTLTEDYELKLDSLLRGYTSMFCSYAILYTEEALGHTENTKRRLRWLTGYKQCDKKYHARIKRQARERGKMNKGEAEYFFGTFPLLLFLAATIVTMLCGISLTVTYALGGDPRWDNAFVQTVAFPGLLLYFLLFAYGVLAFFACGDMFRMLTLKEKLLMLIYNPFYLLEYVPIYLRSIWAVWRDKPQNWKETERITYDDLHDAK